MLCSKLNAFILAGQSATICGILYCTYRYFKSRNKPTVEKSTEDKVNYRFDPETWNTVLFFPDPLPEKEGSTTRKLIWHLEQATSSIDICMFTINFKMLESALKEIGKRGIQIRTVTNCGRVRGSQGIPCIRSRFKRHTFRSTFCNAFVDLMHHKFVIIDNAAVMAGSLNWTTSGMTENHENFAVTTSSQIIERYREEFLRLWKESRPRGISESGRGPRRGNRRNQTGETKNMTATDTRPGSMDIMENKN